MIVSKILQSKAHMGILSVQPDDTVQHAVVQMSQNKIGTMIVSVDGISLAGILSERDIVRELGSHGHCKLTENVETIMTPAAKMVTCTVHDTADTVLKAMTKGRFRHMPVMNEDQILGVISIGDVVKAKLSELSMENEALESMIMGY